MDRRLVTVNLDNKDAGLMVDLSEAGMAVQALARIKPGAVTSVQFELPDTAARIEASGTVAWVDESSGRAGIRFHSLPEAARACLKEWLKASQDRPTTSASGTAAAPALLGPESKVAEIAALQREITSRGLNHDAALDLIVQRARSLTRADGAAVVLGDSRWMTCRATSGTAPPVGADLRPESGLSGECVRTGVTVRCEDTELDPRVDREACRSINLRSAVIVPLFARGNISGLLEAFYASARAFDGRDVLMLRRMADLISATLAGPVSRELRPTPTNAAAVEPAPEHVAHPAPMIPPPPRAASQLAKVACNVCGHENPQANTACEKCEGPLPGSASAEATERASANRTPADSQCEESKPWIALRLNASPRLLALVAVLVLLLGIWGWQEYKSREASAAGPANTTSAIEQSVSR
jgi:hypothetical protein